MTVDGIPLPDGNVKGDELYCPCPGCGHDSFSINIGADPKKRLLGNCYRCKLKVNKQAAMRLFGMGAVRPALADQFAKQAPRPPADLVCAMEAPPDVRQYLHGRGVAGDFWGAIWWSPAERMLYFPTIPTTPLLKPSWNRRRVDQKGWMAMPGSSNASYLYGAPVARTFPPHHVILVEGPFDVLSPARLHPLWADRAVSTLGSSLSEAQAACLRHAEKVLVWYDPDVAGVIGAEKAVALLRNWGVKTEAFHWPKEPGDVTEAAPIELALKKLEVQ